MKLQILGNLIYFEDIGCIYFWLTRNIKFQYFYLKSSPKSNISRDLLSSSSGYLNWFTNESSATFPDPKLALNPFPRGWENLTVGVGSELEPEGWMETLGSDIVLEVCMNCPGSVTKPLFLERAPGSDIEVEVCMKLPGSVLLAPELNIFFWTLLG